MGQPPARRVYVAVFIDAIHVKVRTGRSQTARFTRPSA